jgi:aspartate racemase
MLGILGGMGPAATADFFAKLVRLTPARCDQEHLPLLVSCLPQTPDRSAAILGAGPSPLPHLLAGLRRLTDAGALAVVIPCNSSHHWFEQLQSATSVPILHIADAAIAALDARPRGTGPVMILSTRGTRSSGFFQRKLEAAGYSWGVPDGELQREVDAVIGGIKAGEWVSADAAMARVWQAFADSAISAVLLACTELPLAAERLPPPRFPVVDTTLELARASVAHGLAAGWVAADDASAFAWCAKPGASPRLP